MAWQRQTKAPALMCLPKPTVNIFSQAHIPHEPDDQSQELLHKYLA